MTPREREQQAIAAGRQALLRVCILLPHLAGLAHQVRLQVEWRVATVGIFASGRLAINPDFVATLTPADLCFVLAHELLHLALGTHARGAGGDPQAVNIAHDYIINDILREALGQPVPAGGLDWPGARQTALEVLLARRNRADRHSWRPPWRWPSVLGQALADAGLAGTSPPSAETAEVALDVLSVRRERDWYPDSRLDDLEWRAVQIRAAAAKANSLRILLDVLAIDRASDWGDQPGFWSATATALKSAYPPPWELALQRWFDVRAAGGRGFVRPSRRGADRSDVVLPGRKREGWALHLVLDTSGSMAGDLPGVLGLLAGFCENSGVGAVHVLQCDAEVTADEWVEPEELESYAIRGFGGSDLTPALHRLAEDPQVETALVITDGYIDYPPEPMPYALLWAVLAPAGEEWFQPSYGQVLRIPPPEHRGDSSR